MKKYKLIYADPPWKFNNKKTGGSMQSGAGSQYTVTDIETLKRMDVESLCDDDCLLVMWWVGAMPQEALDLVKAWGFTLKNMNGFVWNKLTVHNKPFFGMGHWTRAGSESAIIATRGNPKPISRSVRAVGNIDGDFDEILSLLSFVGSFNNYKHSKKPKEFRDKCLELIGDVPRLEMFARENYDGWDVFGNECDNSIKIDLKGIE